MDRPELSRQNFKELVSPMRQRREGGQLNTLQTVVLIRHITRVVAADLEVDGHEEKIWSSLTAN